MTEPLDHLNKLIAGLTTHRLATDRMLFVASRDYPSTCNPIDLLRLTNDALQTMRFAVDSAIAYLEPYGIDPHESMPLAVDLLSLDDPILRTGKFDDPEQTGGSIHA
jgi:hypothetical protein